MRPIVLFSTLIIFFLSACSPEAMESDIGSMNTMMQRHSAPIPDEYTGLVNPIPYDEPSFIRGGELFNTYCSTCHGDGGMGDGPTASALDPSPAPIAHTSQMSGDDYLFWRISEGGVPFETAMPVFKTLDETARWDLINYVRALGKGDVSPGQIVGGTLFETEAELAQRAEMLAQAIDQEIITEAEAGIFTKVHLELDQLLAKTGSETLTGNADQIQTDQLAQLVDTGKISQDEANAFQKVHKLLIEAGLMQ